MSPPPPPRAQTDLFGHADAGEALARAVRSGRLAHAWLFAGPPGIGKATLAYRFARWLLAGGPPWRADEVPLHLPPNDPVLRRVAAGAHADLLVMEPQSEPGRRRIIRVEEVRALRHFLSLTPAEGGWRVALIDEADAMEAPSANTLLKTLEEPPPRTVIILVTPAPGRLLPTIRSRCRRLDVFPLPEDTLRGALGAWRPDLPVEARARLAVIAAGSPGRALELANADGLRLAGLVAEALDAPPDAAGAHRLADALAGREAGQAFPTFFALLGRAIAEGLRAAARQSADAPRWVARRPLHAWAEAAGAIGRLAAEAERLSLDRRQAVLVAMETLRGP